MKGKFLFSSVLIIVLTLFMSCDSMYYGVNNINSERTYLSGYILQTLDRGSALLNVKTSDYHYSVVKIVTDSEVYYDDKRISGWFVLIGTYTYESKGNGVKTVPVYIRESEYKPEYQNIYR